MTGSTFRGRLNMNSISVGGSLYMREQAEFGEVALAGADIGGQIDMTGSTFRGSLVMGSISVGGSLFMQEQAEFEEVNMIFARIDSNLDVGGAMLGNLDLTGAEIGGELRLGTKKSDVRWKKYNNENKTSESPRINLQNTTVGALQDTESSWPPALELEGFTYERLGGLKASGKELPHN